MSLAIHGCNCPGGPTATLSPALQQSEMCHFKSPPPPLAGRMEQDDLIRSLPTQTIQGFCDYFKATQPHSPGSQSPLTHSKHLPVSDQPALHAPCSLWPVKRTLKSCSPHRSPSIHMSSTEITFLFQLAIMLQKEKGEICSPHWDLEASKTNRFRTPVCLTY